MSSRHKFAKVGVAIVAAVVLFTTTSAQAATQNLEFVNTGGTVTIGSLPALTLPVPGGGIEGTWDDVTGDFEGLTTFNPISLAANPPTVPVAVVVNLNANGDPNVEGTIDPDTGDASLTASMVLVLEIPSLSITCTSPAFDVVFDSESPGTPFEPLPFDDTSTYTLGLDGAFTVPTFPSSACGAGNEGIVVVLNQTLGTPAEGGIVLPLERGSVPPPPPTTTPTTAAPTTTAASSPATQPRFTG
jgi:hypothetical protein